MKYIVLFIGLLFPLIVSAQRDNYETLMEKGKAEFKKDFENQDFELAVFYLDKAVKMKPNDPEANYFLGYAYSRLNAKDGKTMIGMSLDLTYKTSEHFEKVIKVSPKYKGEMLLLDPYSKLTSEWGSLAMSFWHQGKRDSALWAFSEGKKRGGFNEFFLALSRKSLDDCAKNSILISSGDNTTIPLWYVQIKEKHRTDVSVVDISLLNTDWYPAYLAENKLVGFDLPRSILDTVQYCEWKDSVLSIGDFSWTVKPSYYDQIILRGDRVFLSLLRDNQFRREMYFTSGFMEESRLSLGPYILPLIETDKLNINNNAGFSSEEYLSELGKFLQIMKLIDFNSPDQIGYSEIIRDRILEKMRVMIETNDLASAKQTLALMDKYIPRKKIPYSYDYSKQLDDEIRKILKK
jgi:hypothetical protein